MVFSSCIIFTRHPVSPSRSLRGAEGASPSPVTPVVGVLKRFGVGSPSTGSEEDREAKQVMFSDGIRPGGDLTELDGSSEYRYISYMFLFRDTVNKFVMF